MNEGVDRRLWPGRGRGASAERLERPEFRRRARRRFRDDKYHSETSGDQAP